MNEKLKVGDKYLSIKLAGHDYVHAFKNQNKKGNEPDYKGDGVAVWITTKKDSYGQKVTKEDLL